MVPRIFPIRVIISSFWGRGTGGFRGFVGGGGVEVSIVGEVWSLPYTSSVCAITWPSTVSYFGGGLASVLS